MKYLISIVINDYKRISYNGNTMISKVIYVGSIPAVLVVIKYYIITT